MTLSPFRSEGAKQTNHPLCGCYTVITKTLQTRYNIGVQANCKTKGLKTMAQKLTVYHIQNGCVSATLYLHLRIDEKSSIINIGVVWERFFIDYANIKALK